MKAFYFCAILILLIHGVLVHTHPHDLDEDHHDDHDQDHEDHDDVDADLFQQDELHDESLDVESESPNLDDSVSQEQLLSVLEELNLNTENIDLDEFFDENQDHEENLLDQSVDDTDSDDSSEEDSLDELNTEADSTTGDDFESVLEELDDLNTEAGLATDEDFESVEDFEDTNIDLEDLDLDEHEDAHSSECLYGYCYSYDEFSGEATIDCCDPSSDGLADADIHEADQDLIDLGLLDDDVDERSYEEKMVDCMEKCTRSSRGFFSDLHYNHCHHHCEKKCNGNHPHHPKDPKPDHPHYPKEPKPDHPHHPKEPKSSYEDKMVDCMEKCTRSSRGFFSDLHFDHCVHHCEKKCNGNHPHHPKDPKPDHPHHPKDKCINCMERCHVTARSFLGNLWYEHCHHHCEKKCEEDDPVDPYKPDHSYHPEEYSHEHNGPKHRSCLGNCIDICDEDSSLGRMSQGFKLKILKKKKLSKAKILKAKVLKKKLLKKALLKKLLKKKLLKKALLKKLIKKKLLKKVLLKKVLKKKLLKKKLLKKKLLKKLLKKKLLKKKLLKKKLLKKKLLKKKLLKKPLLKKKKPLVVLGSALG